MENDSYSCVDLHQVVSALLEFKGTRIKEFCEQRLECGADPFDIFGDLQSGLEEIGRGYEDHVFRKYFNSDLIVSGRNMKRAIDLLKPLLPPRSGGKGCVLVGTVEGDVHDIGKTIFAVTLESGGFDIIDLGVDVPSSRFVSEVRQKRPDILSMSALLTTSLPQMGEVVRKLESCGIRDNVRVIIGGRAVTEQFANGIGADAYARDCVEGLRKCRELMNPNL